MVYEVKTIYMSVITRIRDKKLIKVMIIYTYILKILQFYVVEILY